MSNTLLGQFQVISPVEPCNERHEPLTPERRIDAALATHDEKWLATVIDELEREGLMTGELRRYAGRFDTK